MQAKNKQKRTMLLVAAHVIAWVVFLSLPAIFKPRPPGVNSSLFMFVEDIMEPPRWTNALLLMAVFYFNYYLAIPMLYLRRRYIALALSVVACFLFFFLLNYSLTPPELKMRPTGGFEALGNSFNLFMFLIVYVFSFALCLYEQWQKTRARMLSAEISFLKAQINPHFLFNTLNSIYSLALTKSDSAPDAIVKLSGMMRYSVSNGNQDMVSLEKEIAYITDYIALQTLRLTDKIKISYELAGDTDDKQIAPFLLIPFVENAFKYGVNSEEDSNISIKIDIARTGLVLMVTNNKVYMRPDVDKGIGLGIGNTRKRLKVLYPGRHTLSVNDNKEEFSILLQIQFT